MKYCPNCKYEFEDWCEICNDCGAQLTAEPPAQPEEQQQYEEEAFLISVTSSIEADMIISILKGCGIPVLKKYRGIGGYISVYMGASNLGADLYVPKSALSDAKEILAAPPERIEELSTDYVDYKTYDNKNPDKFRNLSRKIIIWVIVLPYIIMLLIFILNRFKFD